MSCTKYQVINTGTTNAYITFRRCDDGGYERDKELVPFRIYNLWVMDDIISSAEITQLTFENEGPFPDGQINGKSFGFRVEVRDYFYQEFYFNANNDIDVTINWGDGTTDEDFATSGSYWEHEYPSPGVYTAFITFSDPSQVYDFELYNGSVTNTSTNFGIFSNLEYLYLNDNYLTSFEPTSLPSTLLDLGLYDNYITNFGPSVGLPDSLEYLDLDNNTMSCDDILNTMDYLRNTYFTNPYIYLYGQSNCGCLSGSTYDFLYNELDEKGYYLDIDEC